MVKFEIPIYGGSVTVFSSREEMAKALEGMEGQEGPDLEECSGVVQPITDSDNRLGFFMGIFDKNPMTIVHECGHVAIFICAHTSWKINDETAEPFCYLLEELVTRSQAILEEDAEPKVEPEPESKAKKRPGKS